MGLRSIKEETKWEIMGQVQLGTLSNRQIAKNFAVSERCKVRLHWGVEEWSRVIFSDESNFEVINRKTKLKVKRFQKKFHEKFVQPRVQGGGGSAGIWGCISHKGPGCASLYSGRINADRYIETLENHLLPSATLF